MSHMSRCLWDGRIVRRCVDAVTSGHECGTVSGLVWYHVRLVLCRIHQRLCNKEEALRFIARSPSNKYTLWGERSCVVRLFDGEEVGVYQQSAPRLPQGNRLLMGALLLHGLCGTSGGTCVYAWYCWWMHCTPRMLPSCYGPCLNVSVSVSVGALLWFVW